MRKPCLLVLGKRSVHIGILAIQVTEPERNNKHHTNILSYNDKGPPYSLK